MGPSRPSIWVGHCCGQGSLGRTNLTTYAPPTAGTVAIGPGAAAAVGAAAMAAAGVAVVDVATPAVAAAAVAAAVETPHPQSQHLLFHYCRSLYRLLSYRPTCPPCD
ncbi:unnamed protein product [Closterium sp. NIES-54]